MAYEPPREWWRRRIQHYGLRNWWFFTPRVLPWWALSIHLTFIDRSHIALGLWADKDEEGEAYLCLSGLLAEVSFYPRRMYSRRERAEARDKFAATWGPKTAEEAEAFLRGEL